MPSINPSSPIGRRELAAQGRALGTSPGEQAYQLWKAAVYAYAPTDDDLLRDIDNGFWQGEYVFAARPPRPNPNRAGGRDVVVNILDPP